jgi:hypothetical protein
VLTSSDPNYQAKIETIVKILSELKNDQAFFSIDEFGPFSVKKRAGRKRVAPGGGLHGATATEVQRQSDHHGCFGTIPQPGDPLPLEQEEHPGDDQDDGSTANPVPKLHDHISLVGCGLVAHFSRAEYPCKTEK